MSWAKKITGAAGILDAAILLGSVAGVVLLAASQLGAQTIAPRPSPLPPESVATSSPAPVDYNQRLLAMERALGHGEQPSGNDYRIGAEDLLAINIFEAPEMNRDVRVSSGGEISLPLLGMVEAAGLTPRELESVLQELLRRTYMKDPHVSVFVREMQSHQVSVFGAVKKPGVFQIRGAKTVVELLSMAEGLAEDAGDTILVIRHPSPTTAAEAGVPSRPVETAANVRHESASAAMSPAPEAPTVEISLKSLLESGDPRLNVLVYPGGVVKVTRAGIVYVVGEVNKPGGFVLKGNENISVLQALALAEGPTHTAANDRARIIRTDEDKGTRQEIPIDLTRILAGKVSDPQLHARDIVFVPNSTGRAALYRGLEAVLQVGTGLAIYRR